MRRLLPPQLLILSWVAMILLAVFVPVGAPFPLAVRGMGAALALAGGLVALRGARLFKRVGTNIMTFGTPDRLVATGLFGWSRNPMYLGFAICALGGALALGAYASLIVAILFCITLDRWYVRFEEAMMQQTFGAEFEAYCRRVRRWF